MTDLSSIHKAIKLAVTLLFSLGLIWTMDSACASEKKLTSISGPELMRLIESDQAPMIIDVRSSREYKRGHIEGAINITFRSNFSKIEEVMADPKRLIVVYCAYGPRAAWAQRNMRKAGLENVILLTGHISKWKRLKLPLIK